MPKQENLKLITTLESAITGLNKAEWEYPFGTFLWDVSEKGAFSIEKIFDIEVVSEDTLLSSLSGHKYKQLLNLLHTYLSNFTIYSISFSAPDAYKINFQEPLITATNSPSIRTIDLGYLISGATSNHYWIASGQYTYHAVIKKEQFSQTTKLMLEKDKFDFSFFKKLENLLATTFSEKYTWEIYPTRDGALKRLFNSTRLITSIEFDGFENQNCDDGISERTQKLSQVLQQNLINITEHRLFDYYLYYIGQTHWGDWAGVWTQQPWH